MLVYMYLHIYKYRAFVMLFIGWRCIQVSGQVWPEQCLAEEAPSAKISQSCLPTLPVHGEHVPSQFTIYSLIY